MVVEVVPDESHLSRHIDSPHKYDAKECGLIERMMFEFPSGADESLVWRKYKVAIEEVHGLGCERQATKRQAGKMNWVYEGAVTSTAGAIRALRNSCGSRFAVEHDPGDAGIHHVSIRLQAPEGHTILKAEKSELRDMLVRAFGPLEAHACPG